MAATLPPSLQKSLQATATITVAELHNEGMAAANNPQEWPFAQISEILDNRTCPLCRRVDGMILRVGTPEHAKWRQPSHINCRRTLIYISKDEQNVRADFEEPEPELIKKHGHYHVQPDKYAELRIPAEPAGRHVVARRVKNLETGEIGTRLDWAPWFEQVPQWKRDLVLQARATADDVQLAQILEKLGITDPTGGDGFQTVARLGLRDRIEGWVTNFPGPPWKNPDAPAFVVAQSHPEAESWALQNIPGLKQVDYSGMDLDVANEFNRVASDICTKFGIELPAIMPSDWPGWMGNGGRPLPKAPMVSTPLGLAYNAVNWQGKGKAALLEYLASRKLDTEASRTIAAYVAHEMGHQLVLRTAEMTRAVAVARIAAEERRYATSRGDAPLRKELGDYALNGGSGELWAEAFSAYWENIYSVSAETREFVRAVLAILYPGVTP
jgi:hypothetical protein